MTDRHVPVLVVGGSLVGLSTSVLLAHHGVPHLLVEHHSGTAIHPRAASFHQRTMEVFRSVGIQSDVEQAAALEFVQNGAIVAVESLGGRELATFFANFNAGVEELSPTPGSSSPRSGSSRSCAIAPRPLAPSTSSGPSSCRCKSIRTTLRRSFARARAAPTSRSRPTMSWPLTVPTAGSGSSWAFRWPGTATSPTA